MTFVKDCSHGLPRHRSPGGLDVRPAVYDNGEVWARTMDSGNDL
jgi:hypothetical protein